MPLVPLPPFGEEGKVSAPPHIHGLADEITQLNMLEVKELVDRIGEHFGFEDEDGFMGDEGGDGGAAEEEVVVEKTAFDLKLMAFDPKTKIKVIKEVRAMTSLGLKEAKELVEGAPVSVCVFDVCVYRNGMYCCGMFCLFVSWGSLLQRGRDETTLGQLAEDQITNYLRSLVRSFLAISIPVLHFGERGFISTM